VTARVLVTRPAGSWPSLAGRFSGTPIELEFTPTTVAAGPLDRREGDAALDQLDRSDWLVVTSGRGVAALAARLAARGGQRLPAGLLCAAVGPATARALESIGAPAAIVAEDAGADGLATALRPRLAAGACVVVVRPEGTPSPLAASLRAAGAEVHEAPLYRTVASDAATRLADEAIDGAFLGVAFTAPSSLDLWLAAAGERRAALAGALAKVKRIAIGKTTAAHLASVALPADAVAETPSELAVGDAIARAVLPFDLLT
jgi:uroporphyrinogen-III synthase